MTWTFVPNYIRQTETQTALGTVTAERWNELWNLNIIQGDHSETELNILINTTLPAFEAEMRAYTNALQTALAATTGATMIGVTPITGVAGTTSQAVAAGLKSLIDTCYKTADANTAIGLRETIADANTLVKTISFDAATGKFTFTHQGGTTTVIDTNLEKVVVNFSYDAANQRLVMTDTAGTVSYVPLSDFITETEFVDSAQLDFSVSSHTVTATIKSGSITDTMLSSVLVAALQGYVSSANTSATNAAASEANALAYKNDAGSYRAGAGNSAYQASESATNAESCMHNASYSETNAATSEANSKTSETNAASAALVAANSATNAATSEANALSYKNAAATSAGNAATSESNAVAANTAIQNMTVAASTLDTGAPATVDKTTIEGVAHLAFGLPRGATGATGPIGATGPQGETGSAATVQVGTVTSGATPAVTNSGTSTAAVLNFVLEKGDTGDTGAAGAAGTDGALIASGNGFAINNGSTRPTLGLKAVDESYVEGQFGVLGAIGDYSHVEGYNTSAEGAYSHAEGYGADAEGASSHAEGINTRASGEAQHVSGRYNIADTTSLEIVGNGTYPAEAEFPIESNARTLDTSGNGWFAGKVSTGTVETPAIPTAANDLTPKQYVDALVNANSASISELNADVDFNVTNIVTNGDFSNGTTGWTTSTLASCTVSGNVATCLADAANDSINQVLTTVVGRKYYFAAQIKATSNLVRFYMSATSKFHSGGGAYELLSSIHTATATSHGLGIMDTRTSGFDAFYVKYVIAIDLTAAFGAGNEPTAAEMDAMLAFYPNSWFDGTVNFASNPKMLPYLLNQIRQLNTEKTGYGVYTGLGVTQQTVADMTVKVATGTIYMGTGTRFTPTVNNALAITAADATNPRIDIVYVNSSGVIAYLAGTAATSPSAPSVPTGGQKLAEITVAAGATTITSAVIADRRKYLWTEAIIIPTLINSWVVDTGTSPIVGYWKDALGIVHFEGAVKSGSSIIFNMATGYRPKRMMVFPVAANGAYGQIAVGTDGGVYYQAGGNIRLNLSGVAFRTDA